jgi:hypothetical protein
MQRAISQGERYAVFLGNVCAPTIAATEVPGTFRVNGSNKRMRELQALFETPPRVCVFYILLVYTHSGAQYGKSLDWKQESYTTHDVASVFRRYLTQMPVRAPVLALNVTDSHQEPVIPHAMYHAVRDALCACARIRLWCALLLTHSQRRTKVKTPSSRRTSASSAQCRARTSTSCSTCLTCCPCLRASRTRT